MPAGFLVGRSLREGVIFLKGRLMKKLLAVLAVLMCWIVVVPGATPVPSDDADTNDSTERFALRPGVVDNGKGDVNNGVQGSGIHNTLAQTEPTSDEFGNGC